MALETELATYQTHLHEWADREGKYVLIHGEQVVGFFAAYEDAIKAGYEKFGLQPFLVRQVHVTEQVQFVSRFVDPAFGAPGS